jgi:hypothetical protein
MVAPTAGALGVGDLVGLAIGGGVYRVDLDAETVELLGTAPSFSGYQTIAAEPGGTLLVAGTDGVQRLDPDTGVFTPLSTESTLHLDVATSGRIFATVGSTVYEVDATTGVRTPLYTSLQPLTGITADVPGAVITLRDVPVSDPLRPDVFQERQVLSIDIATSAVSVLSATVSGSDDGFFNTYFANPFGVDATPSGVVFESFHFTSTMGDGNRVESTTTATPFFLGPEGLEPLGFEVDSAGRLIVGVPGFEVAEETRRISHVSGSNVVELFDLVEPFPPGPEAFLDFAIAVPEPGTLVFVGLGIAALAARRRG